ncbi:MAG: creatininase family protein [Pyrinomonadaceae bacterium]|nr:creatininase family protein [Pyrinomonadaceae bacterium]
MFFLALAADAQIYRIAEMNTEQIRNLNKEKTVVILPGGILEEHGPYLPSFTDGYLNERITEDLSKAIAARPGWTVVVFPTIPLGNSGANVIGGKFSFPGTYAVRFDTLRSVFMDLATELGEQKFKWVFIVHIHGGPNHNRALDQAGDYFRDEYNGRMVNITGLMPVFAGGEDKRTEEERREEGFAIHAGMGETSSMLFLRPDLVNPNYKKAKTFFGKTMEDLIQIARKDDWLGYFAAPRLARADYYQDDFKAVSNLAIVYGLKILDGLDDRTIPRYADIMKKSAPNVSIDDASFKHDAEIRRKQEAWLKKKSL